MKLPTNNHSEYRIEIPVYLLRMYLCPNMDTENGAVAQT